jgi:hypothetical protein
MHIAVRQSALHIALWCCGVVVLKMLKDCNWSEHGATLRGIRTISLAPGRARLHITTSAAHTEERGQNCKDLFSLP